MNIKLIIFDCDGVLVDSEILFNDVLAKEITKLGWPLEVEDCLSLFSGKSALSVDKMIEEKLSKPCPINFRTILNKKIDYIISKNLKPLPYIEEVLKNIDNKCIASSSSMSRIELSLKTTKLLDHFEKNTIFSSQMVKYGKPDPSLFLLAAEKMNVDPHNCLVIEDSVAGIQAAHSANMKAIAFIGASHAKRKEYQEKLFEQRPFLITDNIKKILDYI